MRRVPAMAILLTGAVLLTGCGSSDDKATSSASSKPAPEQVTTSPEAVRTGLNKLVVIATGITAQISDKTKAADLVEGIEPVWEKIEGTVKANSSDTYIALEDAFAVLENAAQKSDATKAKAGSDAVSKAVTAYLAKYPA